MTVLAAAYMCRTRFAMVRWFYREKWGIRETHITTHASDSQYPSLLSMIVLLNGKRKQHLWLVNFLHCFHFDPMRYLRRGSRVFIDFGG